MTDGPPITLNARAHRLADAMAADAAVLRVSMSRGARGERLIDCGSAVPGSLAAGLALAEICLGGLGRVTLDADGALPQCPWRVSVRTSQPVLACLGSQYAGWALEGAAGEGGFRALGSGPARALAAAEAVFRDLGHVETSSVGVLAVEGEGAPPPGVLAAVARACNIGADGLTVVFAPTRSLAGSVQVAARCLEVALTKARQAGFPLDRILDGLASAPLAPPHPDPVMAMGRTNDAIIFGGRAHLFVLGPAPDARRLAEHLPSSTSRRYGEPFGRVFERAGGDFSAIDPHLFAPAEVSVTAVEGGETYRAGRLDLARLEASLG